MAGVKLMDTFPVVIACGSTLLMGGILLRYWQSKYGTSSDISVDLYPVDRLAHFDGWSILELELTNRSNVTVWIEAADLKLSDIEAQFQTALPAGQSLHSIRQAVLPHESISMSLNECIYKAAGNPQGWYSFDFSGAVRYRIEEDWAWANIPPRRIEMTALTVHKLRRARRKSKGAKPGDCQIEVIAKP